MINDLYKEDPNKERKICCEINVTQFFLKPLLPLLKEKEKEIAYESAIETCDQAFKNIVHAIERICRIFLTSYKKNRNDIKKIEIFFDYHKVLHFFKHRYNLRADNIEKLHNLSKHINKKICEYQDLLDNIDQNSINIDYIEKLFDRLFFNFLIYNDDFNKLKEKIESYNSIMMPKIDKIFKIFYNLSCGSIKIEKMNNKFNTPFISTSKLRKEYDSLHNTFLGRLEMVNRDLIREILNLNQPELDLIKCLYTTIQNVAFLNQIIMFNYRLLEHGNYLFLASDCKSNMFLNNLIQFYKIISKSKSEEVNKNTVGSILEKRNIMKRKTNVQENIEKKKAKN